MTRLKTRLKEEGKRGNLKIMMNSMYGSIVTGSKIPSKYFRPISRRLKIENIFDNE